MPDRDAEPTAFLSRPVSRREVLRGAALGAASVGAASLTGAGLPAWGRTGGSGINGLPSARQMMGWIREIVGHGIRRPGYRADRWVERWAADRFEEFGLEDVHLESLEVERWNPGAATLVVEPDERLRGFPAPHTAPGAVDADLTVLTGEPAAGALTDQIAVYEFAPLALPGSAERELGTFVYDPDGEFDALRQTLPFNGSFNNVLEPAIAAGAAGFVGLLTGFPWNTRDYYVPYDGKGRDITAAWFSGDDGRRLLDLIAGGATRGRLEVAAESAPIETHNVIGTLPGASDEWVIVASHHDGPWASAVEDGSGISLVLAQAAYWSKVPARRRPHNMLFLLTAAHMFGGAGTSAFIQENQELVDQTVLEVHLEHAARNCVAENGELVPTDAPEIRWWFTSESPALQGTVRAALESQDLRRSVVFRPDVFFETPPTDGAEFHAAGVPIVHFLTAPMYLFDRRDTIDKIHEASLEPLSRAAVQIIESTAGVSARQMRDGIAPA